MYIFFATVSCKKSIENCEVCDGLLRNGATADSTSFLKPGTDWEFKYFAYTPNGINITHKNVPRIGVLRTNGSDTMEFLCYNTGWYAPQFLAGNNQVKMPGGAQTMVYVPAELPIYYAFDRAVCYAIKGDLLYIHYKELDGNNLFILQKK